MAENEDSLPRLLGGRYRLEAKLGSGGMGVVYRASDLTMHRAVAVKLILGGDGVTLDEDVAGRFLREAKNTARVQHENIIEVYDLGRTDQGDLFFVMELLEGESLSAKLRRDTKLSVATSVHIARQICAALHVAHAAGVIHRDLKPANVMLLERAGQGDYVKVLDFGVAKSYSSDQETQLTHTGMLVGTIEYMAPEQIMGKTVDGRTDIYALGVVLYRMLTGKAPFRDGGVPSLIHAHLNVFAKPMAEGHPSIPGALDRVVLRCLAKKPEQRYGSMEELSRALVAALEPTGVGLVNLEYENDDPYDAGDLTEVARPLRDSTHDDPGAMVLDESFDDATIKIDRPEAGSGLQRRASVPAAGRPASSRPSLPSAGGHAREVDAYDRTAIMSFEDTTGRRSVPEEVARLEKAGPRECAMCKTINPPYARACSACGVSLAREDQEAVRERVAAPRTAHLSAPQMPPPTSGAYPAPPFGHSPAHGVPGVHVGPGMHGVPGVHVGPGMHGVPGVHVGPGMHGGQGMHGGPWGTAPPTAQGAPEPASAWQRFLSWTGLRGR
jgi:serine/threonine protein kinase